jgi:hypothetical protein
MITFYDNIYAHAYIGQNEDNYAVASELIILDKTQKELYL